jgi:dihydropteroate synthase
LKIMGVVNVTPDSFSDGGDFFDREAAVAHGLELFEAGAQIVDVGGESTRPFAEPVEEREELRRVLDVVAALSKHGIVSVDTRHERVAEKAVENGASIINDVGGALAPLAAKLGVAWVAMHMKGDPKTMQLAPAYLDVVSEVIDSLEAMVGRAQDLGVPEVIVDPGIGFGKTAQHNLELLKSVSRLKTFGCEVLLGTSRKRFLAKVTTKERFEPPPKDREEQQLAVEAWCLLNGVDIVRVHEVVKTRQLIDLMKKGQDAHNGLLLQGVTTAEFPTETR